MREAHFQISLIIESQETIKRIKKAGIVMMAKILNNNKLNQINTKKI